MAEVLKLPRKIRYEIELYAGEITSSARSGAELDREVSILMEAGAMPQDFTITVVVEE